jgi:hypothetical protein
VYQLTALEVQLMPIEKQITQSMSHLKTIQYFIGNQGLTIAQEVCFCRIKVIFIHGANVKLVCV